MSAGEVLVIGGTGKVGGNLVRLFLEEGRSVRSASRSGRAPEGAEGTVFDWFDDDGHDAALEGVGSVFMVAPIGASEPLDAMEPFIGRALLRGVRRFVLLSSSLIEEGGPAMGRVHALLRARAPEWAVLRPSWFMENFTIDPHLASVRTSGLVYSATGDGRVPFIAASDIAAVALRTLTDRDPANDGLILTGPDLLTYGDVADLIAAARGSAVEHVNLTTDALSARLEQWGIPGPFASMLAQMDQAIATGAENRVTSTVQDVTGRDPTTFAEFARNRAELWSRNGQISQT